EALYKRALSIVQRAFGMDWDGASEFMTHLGNVYRAQGRYAEAEALYRDALVRNERSWGPAHNLTAETLNDFAVLYAAEGRIDEALPYSRKATAALVSSTLIKPPGPQQREPTPVSWRSTPTIFAIMSPSSPQPSQNRLHPLTVWDRRRLRRRNGPTRQRRPR